MEAHDRQRTRKNKACRIVVRPELGERFAAAFEGMEVKIEELVSVQPEVPQRATRWANREGHGQHPSWRPDAQD